MENLEKNMIYSKLKNKRILIFGNTGFVGSWLCLALNLLNVKILGVSLKMKNKNYFSNLFEFKKKINTIYCDITNLDKVEKKILNFKPEIIIHLASEPIVSTGYKNPKKTYKVNIFGTINILEIARKIRSLKKILVFTSDKVYENNYSLLSEKSNLGGLDPYSSSKSCQDIICQSYNSSFLNKQMIILRSGNIIGGGDWGANRLIPDIFKSYFKKKNLLIRSINSTRPWLHILDVINGILAVLVKDRYKTNTTIYNLAPYSEKQIAVKNILNYIKDYIPIKYNKITTQSKFKESKYLKLSSKKIYKELGWKQKLTIHESINLTIDIYLKDKKTIKSCEDHISKFFNQI